ncbi:formin-like protein 5 [Ictidomys tridecemlineatus]|uniref:formin-like protein 5 n=1 Tax=Ictidomys tridecemlineatus TaxID=43179 RepID=UPI00038C4762|nr:formin-like protein 5 [Ictidomys tridecemlineatus]KAG3267344.1 formin-like protein 5 [Ictidomys tridecemlineatus]
MSGRVTGQPPPRPTPGAGRTRCLSAREPRRSARDSPSALPPQRGSEGWAGKDTIWQSTAAAPCGFQQPPPGRRGNKQAAAAAVAAAAAPHPPPARFLPLLPPPHCHGNAAPRQLAPPLFPSPPPATPTERARPFPLRPLPPPTEGTTRVTRAQGDQNGRWCWHEMRRPQGRGSQARKGGEAVGRCGIWAEPGLGRRENGKVSPVPERTYRSAAEARRGC